MLPQKSLARIAPTRASPLIAFLYFKLDQTRVQRQHHREMIWLCRRRLSERTPESGHAVTRLASDHPFASEIDGGVRIKLEDESFGVLVSSRQLSKLQRFGHARGLHCRRFC